MSKFDVLGKLPIRAWDWPKVLWAVLPERALSHAPEVLWDLMAIASQGADFVEMNWLRTDTARNELAQAFVNSKYTHLMMLDADHKHPRDIIQRLSRRFIQDPDRLVVGGLNFRRGEPYTPCAFWQMDDGRWASPHEWDQGILEVDILGTGCIMIAREVFERIEPPWFWYPYDNDPRITKGNWDVSEDVGFAFKCQEAGIKQWCDTTITSPHARVEWTDQNTYYQHYELMKGTNQQPEIKLVGEE